MTYSNKSIPLIEPYLGKNADRYVAECFNTKWISSRGHFIKDFELRFAQFIGTKYAVAVSNGTVALHLALISLGIGEGDEVIVPDLTFSATINAVLHANATPVIVDIDSDSWNISPVKIKSVITHRTKAIIPVHLYGYPCNMNEIMAIAKSYGLKVIEDCAEAHGASINNKKVGSIGTIGAFSFYGNKIITTGEGGMCTTNNKKLYEKMLLYRDHGMNRKNLYRFDVVGYNYRMTNPQAAIGCSQLEEIEEILKRRDKIALIYQNFLKPSKNFQIPKPSKNMKSVNWLFTCLVEKRDDLISKFLTHKIETRPMFYPLHRMKIYKPYAKHVCTNSIAVSKKGISLPTFLNLTMPDIERICKIIHCK